MEVLGFDMSVLSVTLTLVISVTVTFAWYDRWCHQYFQRLGVPVADNYVPFFGNVYSWGEGLHTAFTDCVRKYGKVVGVYAFRSPILIVTDAEVLKNILVKNFSNFKNRKILPLHNPKPLNKSLTQLKGEKWREVRNVVTPSFSASKMRLMSSTINECCDSLVSNFRLAQEGGKAADCRELYGAFTMDVIARCGFGLNVDSQKNKDDPFVKNAKGIFDFSTTNLLGILTGAFPSLIPIFDYFNFSFIDTNAMKFFSEVTEAACKLRKEEGDQASKKVDMLQLMLNAHNDPDCQEVAHSTGSDSGHRKPLTTEIVTAQAVIFFLAGYETTNGLLAFASYLLALNQNVQEKLHAEIDNLAPNRDGFGYDIINKMEYLDMVINETLRMYPPAAILDRVCNETTTYNGLTIEEGVSVFVSIWTIHYDEDYWTNPTKFDPERFNAENKGSIQPCTFIPFGFGPRNCIGMRFALLEAKMALVRTLQEFRMDVSPETEIPPTLGKVGFLAPKTMMLSAIPRN